MIEKPALPDTEIAACLNAEYGLHVTQITFLPIGNDPNSVLYRATATDGSDYFVKLRSGDFNPMTVVAPRILHDSGCSQIIAPTYTHSHQLWSALRHFQLMLFPFVEGRNGFNVTLSEDNWRELGRSLKQLHASVLPVQYTAQIPRERYSDEWREKVTYFQEAADRTTFADPISAQLADLFRQQRLLIDKLVSRAARLATTRQRQSQSSVQPYVLCHGDIHAGNILLAADGSLYIVDWDKLILAPKERDLMFIGGGQFAHHRSPQQEEALFYQGYGPTSPDQVALSYYRYERIVQDIAEYCEEILLPGKGTKDREEGLRQLSSQFLPNGVVEISFRSEG